MTKEEILRELSVAKLFYFLGAIVVILGIGFFSAQIWPDLGAAGRIFLTLILGLVLAALGSIFLKSKPESWLGQIFHILGGLLIPGGAIVALDEIIGLSILDSFWPIAWVIGAVFVFYLLLTLYHRQPVLTFFALANGTAFVYLAVAAMIQDSAWWRSADDIFAYLTMVIGASYLLFAHSFRGGWNKSLIGLFNFLGAAGFLGAAFSRVFDSPPWQFGFFLLALGGLAFAVFLKSRSVLAVSVLFLVFHFIYITQEYFADSIGWPILLVILGFIFIGLGYLSLTITKKYLHT